MVCRCTRPHVRRRIYARTGELAWVAARPGECYLDGHGLHFRDYDAALAYALRNDQPDTVPGAVSA